LRSLLLDSCIKCIGILLQATRLTLELLRLRVERRCPGITSSLGWWLCHGHRLFGPHVRGETRDQKDTER